MNEAIIVAVLSLIGTLGGSFMGIRQSNRLMNYRIDRLEEKVMKHNDLIERMALAEKDIRVTYKRLDQLEHERRLCS